MNEEEIDREMSVLVQRYGVTNILAALCRHCNDQGLPKLFRKLNAVYEWLTAEDK